VLSQDHLIVDLMNEPDAYGATWTDGGTLPEDVATYYLDAMDALYPLCPGCLFQIQGCGESVHLSLPTMRLCGNHTSSFEVGGRYANAVRFPSPSYSPSLSAGKLASPSAKAHDQVSCSKDITLNTASEKHKIPSHEHCRYYTKHLSLQGCTVVCCTKAMQTCTCHCQPVGMRLPC